MDPTKMKVVDLRQELQERGLDVKGNKAVLLKRLQDALEKEASGETAAPVRSDAPKQADHGETEEEEESSEEVKTPKKEIPKPEPRSTRRRSRSQSVESKPLVKEDSRPLKVEESISEEPQKEAVKSPQKTTSPVKKEESKIVQEEIKSPIKQAQTPSKSPEKSVKSPEKRSKAEEENSQENGDTEEKPEADQEKSAEEKQEEKMDAETRGEKRKRGDDSPEKVEKKKRETNTPVKKERPPIKEDEPEIDPDKPQLSWYDSDLHLKIDKTTFLSAKPINDGAFGYIWSGARATHGVSSGQICYEVKITEELKWEDLSVEEKKEKERVSKYHTDNRRSQKGKKQTDKKSDEKNQKKDDKAVKNDDKTETKEDQEKTEEKAENGEGNTEEPKSAEETEKMESEEQEQQEEKQEVTEENNDSKEEKSEETSEANVTKEGDTSTIETGEKMETDTHEEKKEETKPKEPIPTHFFRVGFSLLGSTLQLGEAKNSFGYESTGKFVNNKEFQEYGATFGVGDVIGAYLSIDENEVTITYTVNGVLQATAITVPRSEFPQEDFAIFPHVLSRNYAFELNFGTKEEPWFPAPEELKEYKFLQQAEEKVVGPTRPENRKECEMLMMVGLPGCGKTHWIRQHLEANADKSYTIIGTGVLFERMTVGGAPLKTLYSGLWKFVCDKVQKCINQLIDLAALRRRNFILDQTNLFPAAQRRKLRAFEGFQRKAVCLVCENEEQERRLKTQEQDYGKALPESTLYDLKAQMELPEKCDFLEEVLFPELNEEEAKKMVIKYHEEAKAKGYFKRVNVRKDNSRPYHNNYRDRGYRGGRHDRYNQGGWNRPSGRPMGGAPWGRDRRDSRGPPPRGASRGGWGGSNRGYPARSDRDRAPHNSPRQSSGYGGNRDRQQAPRGRSVTPWQQSQGNNAWGTGNTSGGGWNAQMYGSHGYGAWNKQGQNWNYSGNQGYNSTQGNNYSNQSSGYGTGQSYGNQAQTGNTGYGQQSWNYYGQYGQQQGWGGNQQAQSTSGQGASGGQWGNYSQQDWAQSARQYAQQQQRSQSRYK